jgi:hypothetical protein
MILWYGFDSVMHLQCVVWRTACDQYEQDSDLHLGKPDDGKYHPRERRHTHNEMKYGQYVALKPFKKAHDDTEHCPDQKCYIERYQNPQDRDKCMPDMLPGEHHFKKLVQKRTQIGNQIGRNKMGGNLPGHKNEPNGDDSSLILFETALNFFEHNTSPSLQLN